MASEAKHERRRSVEQDLSQVDWRARLDALSVADASKSHVER